MPKKKKATKKISLSGVQQYFVLVTPSLVFFGMLRLMIFYDEFGVNILPFLDFGEIITSFFDFITFSLFTIFGALSTTFFSDGRFAILKIPKEKVKIINDNQQSFLLWKYIKAFPELVATLVFIIGGSTCLYLFTDTFSRIEVFYGAAFVIIMCAYLILMSEVGLKLKKIKASRGHRILVKILIHVGTISILVIAISKYEAWRIQNEPNPQNLTLVLKNGEVVDSDKNIFYIGNTRNFVFFFNRQEGSTTIYPNEEIARQKLSRNYKNN